MDYGGYLLQKQTFQLLSAVAQSLAIGSVHDPDERIGLLEVVLPICPECLLTSDIPSTNVSQSTLLARIRRGEADRYSVCSFSLYQPSLASFCHTCLCSPIVFNSLDDEPKRRTDSVHILVHDPLHYRRLAGIVESSSHR